MGIDFGERRVGIALSDPDRRISFPEGYLSWSSGRELLERIESLCRDREVEAVVIGWPRSLSGGEGSQAERIRNWAEKLGQALGLEVSLWDERLTSRQAQREMHAMGEKVGRKKGRVDELAAALMLQSYLDSRNRPSE